LFFIAYNQPDISAGICGDGKEFDPDKFNVDFFFQYFTKENMDEMNVKAIQTCLGVLWEVNFLNGNHDSDIKDILKYANEKAWPNKKDHKKTDKAVIKQIKTRLRADYVADMKKSR
jgi:hypothetical protein